MKKLIAIFLCLLLTAALFAGCSGSDETPDTTKAQAPETTAAQTEPVQTAAPVDPAASGSYDPEQTLNPGEPSEEVAGKLAFTDDTNALANGDVAYVVIYNPFLNDDSRRNGDNWYFDTVNTGDISTQIDVDMNRADDLPLELTNGWLSQSDLPAADTSRMIFEQDRAGGLPGIYSVGESHDFFTYNDSFTDRNLESYTCCYAGEHCYVWVNDKTAVPDNLIQRYGQTFDEEIFATDNMLFGSDRFTEQGGKVNILFYDITRNYYGYFTGLDNFFSFEFASEEEARQYKSNTDEAIIFINANIARHEEEAESIISTLAHEYQHQICDSSRIASFYNSGHLAEVDTWFNEAMSGFVEEYMYPGIQEKDGRYQALHTSDTLREGQSLYNFSTEQGIGAYGSVFLFAEYLANLDGGVQVFHNFHDYWRYSGSETLCTAEAICYAVSQETRDYINEKYPYTLNDPSVTPEQEWLSKLTLDYYLSMLHYDVSSSETFALVDADKLLFNSLYPTDLDLESGGRTVFAVGDGFSVPMDAENGLIYVGLDENYLPVGVGVIH